MVAACILCVYIVCCDNSNKIPRYSVNTYYVQSTVLGANQYKFSSQSCQWLAVWFRASPLILVCLISPTCKVGMTLLSTYLPHRGVVRIHGVTFGAWNLLEELRRKHLFFSVVLPTCGDAKDPRPASSSRRHSPEPSRRNTRRGTAGTRSSFFPVILLESNSLAERTLNMPSQLIISCKQSSVLCVCRSLSFVAWTHAGVLSFVDSRALITLPVFGLSERSKAQEHDGFHGSGGERIWLIFLSRCLPVCNVFFWKQTLRDVLKWWSVKRITARASKHFVQCTLYAVFLMQLLRCSQPLPCERKAMPGTNVNVS